MASSKRQLMFVNRFNRMRPLYGRQSIARLFEVWSFKPFWSEVEKKVEQWPLESLISWLSLFYLVQMKMQLLFFSSQENFLKKEAGYGRTFQFRLNVFVQGFGKKML